MINWAISTARAAWYDVYEPRRLGRERATAVGQWSYGDPLITCYIPTYNRVDTLLRRGLASVCNQTYRNLEIIVAAHGCTDGTVPAVKAIAKGDRRIKVLEVPRKQTYPPTPENHWFAGPVVPANAALKAATGDWIARNDDDDEWTPDHIEKLLRFAQQGDYEFVSSAYQREEDGVCEVVPHDGEDPPIGGTQTWLYRSYLKFMRYNPDCWRKTWNMVNDTDLADRFRKAGVRIGCLDEVTTYIRPRPGEVTVGLTAYKLDAEKTLERYAF